MSLMFSIVTVTFNSAKTLEQTIKSVLSQGYTDFEYIIVDGASTDGTLDIIKRYASSDSRIKYISEPDGGIYEAMNKGISMSTGEVVALLNSDDYYEPNALESVANYIPNVDSYVVYGVVRFLEGNSETWIARNNHNSIPHRMVYHPGCFVSKNIYMKYRYDEKYKSAADYDLFIKLFQDKDVLFIPINDVLVNFRLGGMSSTARGLLETNDIRYKYGFISRRRYLRSKIWIKIKRMIVK